MRQFTEPEVAAFAALFEALPDMSEDEAAHAQLATVAVADKPAGWPEDMFQTMMLSGLMRAWKRDGGTPKAKLIAADEDGCVAYFMHLEMPS